MKQLRLQTAAQLVAQQLHPLQAQAQLTSTATTTVDETPEDPAEVMKREFTKVGTTVLFDFDSSQLSDYARRVLDRQAGFLKAQPEARIILGGHADERGTTANTTLHWVSAALQPHVTIS